MSNRAKALLVIGVLLAILAGSVSLILFGARYAASHVPGQALVAVEIAGPLPERAAEDPFAELLGPRLITQQELREAFLTAAGDDRVKAVRVRIGDLSASFASIQEIRDLLLQISAAGKETVAYLDTVGEFSPGNLQYYLATGCRRIVINPLGDVNLVGLSARVPFIHGALTGLGIEPEFMGIGDYKTARFFFTEEDLTPAHREMTEWLLASIGGQLEAGIAEGRGLTVESVRDLIAQGPYLGPQALEAGLVDELRPWEECRQETLRDGGSSLDEISMRRYLRGGHVYDGGAPIAVVVAEGAIARGASGYSPVPLFGGDIMGSDTIARAFRQVRESDARAVILRIDSPGGSAVASEAIRAEVERTAESIPVVVSMSGVAASGGYWITCGAQEVLADPGTITASIGVYVGHFAMERFWNDKLGVTWGRVDGAPNAGLFGALDQWTPAQRDVAQRFLDRIYDAFLDRVTSARGMSRDEVDALGRGRVFTGQQAAERGLIDGLGGFIAAVDAAKEMAGIDADEDVELIYYPRLPTVLERLLNDPWAAARGRTETLEALVNGRLGIGGPVWMPPIEIR